MATNTLGDEKEAARQTSARYLPDWKTMLFGFVVLALFALGAWMRLHDLGVPFDRDGYDEGVYWQSLRAMSEGHALYQPIFYSQPPFFLLSLFPTYLLFGQTLWAARFGIVVISFLGLLGAFLLGKALGGRIGALAALLLLVANPLYLSESLTIQAEAPSTALVLLAAAFAYLWWESPDGVAGMCFAAFSTITLSLGILSKLLGVTALLPLGLLALVYVWRLFHKQLGTRLVSARSLLAGLVALLVTMVVVLLPFVGTLHQFVRDVVTFHVAAETTFKQTQANNLTIIWSALVSPLTLVALYGTIVAILKRDWRAIPLLVWFIGTLLLLWKQIPLFPHHLVLVIVPMIALAVLGIRPLTFDEQHGSFLKKLSTLIALVLILGVATVNIEQSRQYLRGEHAQGMVDTNQQAIAVAKDVRNATQPGQLVITDAQFLLGLANRSTPPSLVDISLVRIQTGYVTAPQLIRAASRPQVHAVLFYTGRLSIPQLADFHTWVAQHFRLLHDYGAGRELWIRV